MREVDAPDLVETVREGLLLDSDLTIGFANSSFCHAVPVAREDAFGRKLYVLGNGQWNILDRTHVRHTCIAAGLSCVRFQTDSSIDGSHLRARFLATQGPTFNIGVLS